MKPKSCHGFRGDFFLSAYSWDPNAVAQFQYLFVTEFILLFLANHAQDSRDGRNMVSKEPLGRIVPNMEAEALSVGKRFLVNGPRTL